MGQFQAPDASHTFGGGITDSALNPVYLIVMLLSIGLILALPRKHLIVPFAIGIFLIPLGQQVYALGVHWLVGRIIVLATLGRLATLQSGSKAGPLGGRMNGMDKAFMACTLCQSVAFVLLYHDGGALINQFGFLIDYLAAYVVVRVMIQTEADMYKAIKCLALLTVVLAAGMVWEQLTLQNLFGVLGGTRAVPEIREGKIRSQGAFAHSLTAGVFGATLVPLFFLLWKNGRARVLAMIGLVGCTVMTICSNSSTPLLGWVAGAGGVCLWPIRRHMRIVRRGLAATLVILHLIMKAPVWFLIARIDLTGGSSGYHRAELVDQFIRHFTDWWLIGTSGAGSWGWDLWDQQNEFVSVGETGGLLALWLFVLTIKIAYHQLGLSRRRQEHSKKEWQLWFLGAAMLSNIVSFFGVNYFDQVRVSYFMLLAMIIAATNCVTEARPEDHKPALQWWTPHVEIGDNIPA